MCINRDTCDVASPHPYLNIGSPYYVKYWLSILKYWLSLLKYWLSFFTILAFLIET